MSFDRTHFNLKYFFPAHYQAHSCCLPLCMCQKILDGTRQAQNTTTLLEICLVCVVLVGMLVQVLFWSHVFHLFPNTVKCFIIEYCCCLFCRTATRTHEIKVKNTKGKREALTMLAKSPFCPFSLSVFCAFSSLDLSCSSLVWHYLAHPPPIRAQASPGRFFIPRILAPGRRP